MNKAIIIVGLCMIFISQVVSADCNVIFPEYKYNIKNDGICQCGEDPITASEDCRVGEDKMFCIKSDCAPRQPWFSRFIVFAIILVWIIIQVKKKNGN